MNRTSAGAWQRAAALWLILALCALCSLQPLRVARACGGPDYGDLSVLTPLDAQLSRITHVEEDWQWDSIPEFKFLYPFLKDQPKTYAELDAFQLSGSVNSPPLSVGALDKAMQLGDLKLSKQAAQDLVDSWLGLPAPVAADQRTPVWQAVERLELEADLAKLSASDRAAYWQYRPIAKPDSAAGQRLKLAAAVRWPAPQTTLPHRPDHPRAASLELWQVMRHLRERIPNGWQPGIQKSTPASTFNALDSELDAWLKRYPTHPLRDYARLFKVRIYYFAGRFDDAWNTLLALHPAQPLRSVGEMLYLLRTGHPASAAVLRGARDPVLITAMLGTQIVEPAGSPRALTSQRWDELWRLSLSAPRASWSTNLQERLLWWTARQSSPSALPSEFPDGPSAAPPTALWGKLRAVSLVKGGKKISARTQLQKLQADPDAAALLGQLYLSQGQAERALSLSKLSHHSQRYLVQVELTTPALKRSAQRGSPAAQLIDLELSARAASRGDWKQAAASSKDPERAALYREAAKLRAKQQLEYARFLTDHHGRLFFDYDRGYYRGLGGRYSQLPKGDPARAKIEAAMRRSDERWLALVQFTAWLEKHASRAAARGVLNEADKTYIKLTSSSGADQFWTEYAPKTKLVRRLRKVGRRIRSSSP